MLNSTIVANINGGLPARQKISSSLQSSLLVPVGFSKSGVTANSSSEQQRSLQKSTEKGTSNMIFNGQPKGNCSFLDQNRNPQSKQVRMVNGNKNAADTDDGVPIPKVCLYSGKINSDWQQSHKIGAGLVNLGNTCFMNTVLQCLTYCPPLANYLLHDSDHVSKCKTSGFCMMCELQRHMKRVISRPGDIIKPIHVYQRLPYIAKHFQFGRQEDAHEFLRYVIDNLWKACLSNYDGYTKLDPASKETTVINQIFGGYHRSQVICLRCKEKSNTYDHFMDLMLDVKQNVLTLEKALDKFIQPELLQNENAYKCPQCKMKVSAHKKFTVFKAPNVATFQFKRFDYHRMCGGKITKHITYPENLNLRPYMSNPKGPPVSYRLNAVLVHLGTSCNSGHYFCYVKNSNGFWYIMDDARVQQVSINQVLNQNAYVLFYVRVNPSETVAAKKTTEHATVTVKNNHVLKNGFVGSGNCGTSPNSRSSPSVKSTAIPGISKLTVSSPSNSLQNGTSAKHKQVLQPLGQKREKISFSIGSNNSSSTKENSLNKPGSNCLKTTSSPKPVLNGNTLVPYIEDSSDDTSEDENSVKEKDSQSIRKTCETFSAIKTNGRNADKNVTQSKEKAAKSDATPFKPFSSNSSNIMAQSQKSIDLDVGDSSSGRRMESAPTTTASLSKEKSENLCAIDREKQSKNLNSLCNVNQLPPNPCLTSSSLKVNATSSWTVTEMSVQSPSVASGSSTNSVNSTTDWNIVDQESISKRKADRSSLSGNVQVFRNLERNPKVNDKIRSSAEAKLRRLKAGAEVSDDKDKVVQTQSDCNDSRVQNIKDLDVKQDSDQLENGCKLSRSPVAVSAPNLFSSKVECESDHQVMLVEHRCSSPPDSDVKKPATETSLPSDKHKEPQLPFRNQSFQDLGTDAFLDSHENLTRKTASQRDPETKKQNPLKRPLSDASENAGAEWSTQLSDSYEDCSDSMPKKLKTDGNSDIKSERKFSAVVEQSEIDEGFSSKNQGKRSSSNTLFKNHLEPSESSNLSKISRDKQDSSPLKVRDFTIHKDPEKQRHIELEKSRSSALGNTCTKRPTSFSGSDDKSSANSSHVKPADIIKEKRKRTSIDAHLNADDSSSDEENRKHLISQQNFRTSLDSSSRLLSNSYQNDCKKSLLHQEFCRNQHTSISKTRKSLACSKADDSANSDSSSSNHSSLGKLEYSWVEKTKETMDRESTSKVPSGSWSLESESKRKSSQESWINSASERNKANDVVSELQRKSNNVFGADVGSWNNSRKSPELENKPRSHFDEYDDDLDKGKLRHRKKHQHQRNHYRYNPFEAYARDRKGNVERFDEGYQRQRFCPKRYRYQDRYYSRPYKNNDKYFSRVPPGLPRHFHRR